MSILIPMNSVNNAEKNKTEEEIEMFYEAISCPQKLLDKYNNGSYWRRINESQEAVTELPPTTTTSWLNYVESSDYTPLFYVHEFLKPFFNDDYATIYIDFISLLMAVFLLGINRKRWIKSDGLRIFTNYLLAFILFRTVSRLLEYIYYAVWQILLYKIAWCALETNDKNNKTKIFYVDDPNEWNDLEPINIEIFGIKLYYLILDNLQAIKICHIYILLAQIGLHRLSIYLASAFPNVYKKHFSSMRLHIYYFFISAIFMIYQYVYYLQPNGFELYRNVFKNIGKIFILILILFHCTITAVSIRTLMKIPQTKIRERKEIKPFMAFSVYPILVALVKLLYGVNKSGGNILDFKVPQHWTSTIYIWFSTTEKFFPLFLCSMFFIFLPQYRKMVSPIFCCFKKFVKKNQVCPQTTF